MRRWYEVWQERVAATERLRMCIAAKRISFRLFKQIYWQSFDEDIQVRLMSPGRLATAYIQRHLVQHHGSAGGPLNLSTACT